jgi:uncharacterized membrane-anchored protein
MNQKKILYLTIVFWLLIFSGFILYKEYTLRTGTEILLKTEPVDPRDLFRGDYVTLNYEISTLDLDEIPAEDSDFNYNDRIYLALELKDGYGVPKKIYKNPPDNELYIKGTVKELLYEWEPYEDRGITEEPTEEPVEESIEEPVEEPVEEPTEEPVEESHVKELRVEYGIESYFVPEGKGMEIESQQWTGEEGVDVKVAVDKFGNAVIKSLLIDGTEVEI